MSTNQSPQTLLEALVDIAALRQENDALRRENNGLHEWAEKDRLTIAGYRKSFAELRAELDNRLAENASLRTDLESETGWAKHYANRAQEFRDAVAALLAYRDRNSALTVQLEKMDGYLHNLRVLMEKQP
jgi:hypothetical protein